MRRIGYLLPEFPSQTHIFFWREIAILKERGIDPDLVSTRLPPRATISHTWAREAMERTAYLAPPSPLEMAETLRELARSAPAGWARCVASIARAEGLRGPFGKLRLAALAVMGGRLASLARARGWVHVHAHSCADAAHVAMFANLLSGIPYSLTLHARLSHYGPNQREKWRHARFAVVITETLFKEVREALSGSLPPFVDIAPMGVDAVKFVRRAPYQPWDGRAPLEIFSCGRLNPTKGHQDLIQAVALLRARGVDVKLSIAGEDEAGGTTYRRVLEAKIAKQELGDAVRLLGAVSEDRVKDELGRAHLFSLASHDEGLGVAIMEAMAMRVPLVATRVGGVPELVEHGVDGVLVPPESPAELADALLGIALDPALALRLTEHARHKVETSFHVGRSADALARNVLSSATP